MSWSKEITETITTTKHCCLKCDRVYTSKVDLFSHIMETHFPQHEIGSNLAYFIDSEEAMEIAIWAHRLRREGSPFEGPGWYYEYIPAKYLLFPTGRRILAPIKAWEEELLQQISSLQKEISEISKLLEG